jgi:serine/threonine protein kinase
LYYSIGYTNKDEKQAEQMHSLVGTFIKEELDEIINKKMVVYPFSLRFVQNKKTFYSIRKEDKDEWIKNLKEAIGYSSLYDYYELKETLGKGKFGLVRLGIHKKTQKKVAVKIMKKADMTPQDIELVKREVEILKLCQHPNVIRLLDIFENADYIYIIMENMRGGDLFNYLEKRDFHISEARACFIVHSLATALYYLHSYGIAHRDLKPENILMVDESEDADVKIVDFGLSKIVGPDEKCTDPFGTLSYVAPEVLLQQPYDKNVDVWSLGVVAYLLLSGILPFDNDCDREIVRQTIYDLPDFTHSGWKKISKEAIDLVSSNR